MEDDFVISGSKSFPQWNVNSSEVVDCAMQPVIPSQPLHSSEIDFNKDFSICYVWDNGKILARGLCTFGAEQFKGARCIKELHLFQMMIGYGPAKLTELPQKVAKKILDFAAELALNQINDDIRIITCFENYMKAILVSNGYLIHKVINTPEYKPLMKRQRDAAVNLTDIVAISNFKKKEIPDPDSKVIVYLPGIQKETIHMSWMLKDGYQEVIKLPGEVHRVLKDINKRRNELHMMNNAGASFGKEVIKDYLILDDFVDEEVIPYVQKMERYTLKENP